MSTKRRGLGRNLEALLGTSGAPGAAPAAGKHAAAAAAAPAPGEALRKLPVALLQRGKYQPRRDMHEESLAELADSIKAQGVIQPVVVRPIGQGRYEIIAGERRWRAAQLAGLEEVPVVVRPVSDRAAIAMSLIENIQREDLNPLEEANALKRLVDEFKLTHDEAAQAVGRSRAAVSNLLRLLDLSGEVKKLIEAGKLEMGQARALLALSSLTQVQVAQTVVAKGLSTRETEALVKRTLTDAGKPHGRKPAPAKDPNVKRLEQSLSEKLGAPVTIEHHKDGKGRLVVGYASLDELESILDRIGR